MHCKELKAKLKTKFPDSVQDSQALHTNSCQSNARVQNVQSCAKKYIRGRVGTQRAASAAVCSMQCSADDNA